MKTGLVARSRAMRALLDELRRYAVSDANVLITGETGAGKDTVARALHESGPRRREPFIPVDCLSLPVTLLESELFGHERGAFTDATSGRAGRFEMAGRGCVYLDRVNELPLEIQPKLLRVVEEKRGERRRQPPRSRRTSGRGTSASSATSSSGRSSTRSGQSGIRISSSSGRTIPKLCSDRLLQEDPRWRRSNADTSS